MAFNNKTILITGASSGIGEAMAYLLAEVGTQLVLTGRNKERLQAVEEKCRALHATASGFSVRSFIVDFSDTTAIDRFVAELTKIESVFDCIILNAGVSQRALTLETDFSVDRQIMETNYFAPVYLTKTLHANARLNKPLRIAVTSSISGLFGFSLRSAYCASKHALFGFFESLELENDDIRVTFLIPGRIRTPISQNAVLGDGSAYAKMDGGQANGMDVAQCARIALRAIAKGKHRKLIGGKELLMVYIKRWIPPLFYKLARNISAT
jgi:short-subunit dehydrogenase